MSSVQRLAPIARWSPPERVGALFVVSETPVDPVLSSMSSTTTWEWGDVDRDGDAGFLDALLQVRAFKDDFSEVTIEAADLEPCTPDGDVGFLDIAMTIMAFKDRLYTDSAAPIRARRGNRRRERGKRQEEGKRQ